MRHHTTLFNLMMVLLPQFLRQKCQTLSPSQQLIYRTIPTSFRHSLKSVLKSHSKKTGNITRVISPKYPTVPIGSAINPTSTRNRKTGELLSLILPGRGRISALKASFFLPSHNWSLFQHITSAHHGSAQNLLRTCPCSLLTALDMNRGSGPFVPSIFF